MCLKNQPVYCWVIVMTLVLTVTTCKLRTPEESGDEAVGFLAEDTVTQIHRIKERGKLIAVTDYNSPTILYFGALLWGTILNVPNSLRNRLM